MKIVIEIPDDLYELLLEEKKQGYRHEFYERLIMCGTPIEQEPRDKE